VLDDRLGYFALVTLHAEAGPDDTTRCGRVLGQRYELARLLGAGGAGDVYLAHDRVLDREVAIKLLRPGQDELAHARLRSEARIAGALAHPGIARLLGFEEEQTSAGPVPYLVMEYVDGRTLREVLRSGDRLSVDTVLRLVGQIAEALAVVHRAGIVHRDLKPGNIMLARDGRAVLLDFGIARHHDEEPLTLTGTIIGPVDYISPEQAAGGSATAASDLYALGTVAYECLTGLRPLSRDTQVSTLMAHATIPVPPLPPRYPAGVRELVAAMVALDPAHRPAGAQAVAQRARALLEQPEHTREIAAVPASRPATGLVAAVGRLWAGRDARRHLAAAGCAAALALVLGTILLNRTHAPVAAADVVASGAPAPSVSSSISTAPGAGAVPSPKPSARHTHAVVAVAHPAAPAPHRAARPARPAHHVAVHHHHGHGHAHAQHPHGHGHHGRR
jgi:serine/threonine-protein kinase